MNKNIIALDVDDVLAAFAPHAHDFHKVPFEKCHYWCVDTMDRILGKKWFTEHIAPVKEFWRTLPVLSKPEDIDFEFHYYISSFPEEMYDLRVEWLKEHGFPEKPLIIASNKLEKCLELGVNVMVDDKPQTIQSMIGSPVRGIHFHNHYAGFDPVGEHVIHNLKEVKNHLW